MNAGTYLAAVDKLVAGSNHTLVYTHALHRGGGAKQTLGQHRITGDFDQVDLAHHAQRITDG